MIDTIENAIINKLETADLDMSVQAFPSRPEEYKQLPTGKGLALVAYRGSSLSEPTNTDAIVQERVMQFAVTLQVRDLRGHQGAYPKLEAVRSALSGYSPLGDLRVMYMIDERLLRLIQNLWVWEQTWELNVRQA